MHSRGRSRDTSEAPPEPQTSGSAALCAMRERLDYLNFHQYLVIILLDENAHRIHAY